MKKICMALLLSLILCFMVGCQDKEAMAELEEFRAQAQVEEHNQEIVERVVAELNKGNAGDLEVYKELMAPDYRIYSPSNSRRPLTLEGELDFLKPVFEAFPDCHWSIEDSIAAGDKVVYRFVFRGTHEGEFMDIPPTGNKVEVSGIVISRFENGKIIEDREDYDAGGWMQQIGMELRPKEGGK
jgi:steroid delta-isomerase-like uncharacterized protein